jgi:hypothetical protein
MKLDEDRIGAFVDDELTSAEAEALANVAADDPALARRIRRQERLRSRLRGAYGALLDEPAPAHLVRLLAQEPPVSAWRRPWTRVLAPAGAGFALAASIAIVVGLWNGTGRADIALSKSGALAAKGTLAEALNHRLGTDADPTAGVQLVESFKAADGRYCRIFRSRAPIETTGLACKGSGGWAIASLASPARRPDRVYRQAGSGLPRGVVAAMDELGLSQPLTAEEEAAARAADWTGGSGAR